MLGVWNIGPIRFKKSFHYVAYRSAILIKIKICAVVSFYKIKIVYTVVAYRFLGLLFFVSEANTLINVFFFIQFSKNLIIILHYRINDDIKSWNLLCIPFTFFYKTVFVNCNECFMCFNIKLLHYLVAVIANFKTKFVAMNSSIKVCNKRNDISDRYKCLSNICITLAIRFALIKITL